MLSVMPSSSSLPSSSYKGYTYAWYFLISIKMVHMRFESVFYICQDGIILLIYFFNLFFYYLYCLSRSLFLSMSHPRLSPAANASRIHAFQSAAGLCWLLNDLIREIRTEGDAAQHSTATMWWEINSIFFWTCFSIKNTKCYTKWIV